jgi:hypothetical protein
MSLKASDCPPAVAIAFLLLASIAQGQTINGDATDSVDPNNATPAVGAHTKALTYGIDVGIGESDNVTLVSTDKVSQTIAVTDADIDFKQQSRRFDIDAKGNFTYLDYLQNAYNAQLIGRFDGTADVALVPEHLTWALQESFGQAQIDPFTAATPTNLENVNYVSTGPDLHVRLGSTFYVNMTARYARTTYQTDPFDSNVATGGAALGMALSAQSSISINGSFERMLFDNTVLNTDFNRSSAYGQYAIHGARTDLTANLGVSKVEQGSETFTAPDAKLQISRKLSSVSTLTFTVGRDITDASTAFANLQSGAIGGIVTAPAAISQNNYTATHGSLDWEYARNRTTFGVSGTWEKDSYDGQPLQDLTRGSAEFRFERKLSGVLSAQLLGSLFRTEYINTDFSETDGLVGAALMFREGRGLEIKLRYDHSSRVVSGVGSGYNENRVFLTVGYRPRTAHST